MPYVSSINDDIKTRLIMVNSYTAITNDYFKIVFKLNSQYMFQGSNKPLYVKKTELS